VLQLASGAKGDSANATKHLHQIMRHRDPNLPQSVLACLRYADGMQRAVAVRGRALGLRGGGACCAKPTEEKAVELIANNSAEGESNDRQLTFEEAIMMTSSAMGHPRLSMYSMQVHEAGLQGILGSPPRSNNLIGAMMHEHCDGPESRHWFNVLNQPGQTTPQIEWWFVYDAPRGLSELGINSYPAQCPRTSPAEAGFLSAGRTARPLHEYEQLMQSLNDRLAASAGHSAELVNLYEVLAAVLYSGPMYSQYNSPLRNLLNSSDAICPYRTTTFVISSALRKLSKLTPIGLVYRGLAGGLPEGFIEPNALGSRGACEAGFMSTTTDRQVALAYLRSPSEGCSLLLEIDQGISSRGADLGALGLAQFAYEREVTFPPCTWLELKSVRLEASKTLIFSITPSCSNVTLVEERAMMVTISDGQRRRLRDVAAEYVQAESNDFERYSAGTMTAGQPADAALGVDRYLGLSIKEIWGRMSVGLPQIVQEVNASGDPDAIECLRYILEGVAGSSDTVWSHAQHRLMDRFYNPAGEVDDTLDDGRSGKDLSHFVEHRTALDAGLEVEHVVACRLYTSAAYRLINNPLRDAGTALQRDERPTAHPAPTLVAYLADGIRRLRGVQGLDPATKDTKLELWRGNRDLKLEECFRTLGGTDIAPVSTSTDVRVALNYSNRAETRLIFKLVTNGFMERGASIAFLSCFPGEAEYVYPPLTYLRPTGMVEEIELPGGVRYIAVEVHPSM